MGEGDPMKDELRNSYDSFKMLESVKAKEYMDRADIVKLL